KDYGVDTIIHLAALLSAKAESEPQKAWNLNMGGLINALEVARELDLKFFTPSSIGSFGPTTPKDGTPQDVIQRPTTMYGINKVAGDVSLIYFPVRFGFDTRGVGFAGLNSHETKPGGGTTNYAVQISYDAVKHQSFSSYIAENTYMDMMYMPDALKAIVDLMEADPDKLKHRNAFNISAISAAPKDFAAAIREYIPEFTINYEVDPVRQRIAERWPNSIDTSAATEEWGFEVKYDLSRMTKDMLEKLGGKQMAKTV